MALTVFENVKNEMLEALRIAEDNIAGLKLIYSDGLSSFYAIVFQEPVNGETTQLDDVTFDVIPNKTVIGFELQNSSEVKQIDYRFETNYNYPNQGTFTISGAKVVIN